jgi:hypothetical protein
MQKEMLYKLLRNFIMVEAAMYILHNVGFEVFAEVTMKNAVF